MKSLIIEKAKKDFNQQIVNINSSLLENYILDREKITPSFQFDKTPTEGMFLNIFSFILGFNSINFQLWSLDDVNAFIPYYNHDTPGYFALREGFRELRKEIKHKKVKFNTITEADIYDLFGELPDLHKRLEILKETLDPTKLQEAFDIVSKDAEKGIIDVNTADAISKIFPASFSDPYYAKVQLALYEISELFKLRYPNLKLDLTVSANYQIAKMLRNIGIIAYNSELTSQIENKIIIPEYSPEELAIRAAVTLACEKICYFNNISAQQLYQLLWNQRRSLGNVKFHLTNTTNY